MLALLLLHTSSALAQSVLVEEPPPPEAAPARPVVAYNAGQGWFNFFLSAGDTSPQQAEGDIPGELSVLPTVGAAVQLGPSEDLVAWEGVSCRTRNAPHPLAGLGATPAGATRLRVEVRVEPWASPGEGACLAQTQRGPLPVGVRVLDLRTNR